MAKKLINEDSLSDVLAAVKLYVDTKTPGVGSGGGSDSIDDVPNDGEYYVRRNGAWVRLKDVPVSKFPSDICNCVGGNPDYPYLDSDIHIKANLDLIPANGAGPGLETSALEFEVTYHSSNITNKCTIEVVDLEKHHNRVTESGYSGRFNIAQIDGWDYESDEEYMEFKVIYEEKYNTIKIPCQQLGTFEKMIYIGKTQKDALTMGNVAEIQVYIDEYEQYSSGVTRFKNKLPVEFYNYDLQIEYEETDQCSHISERIKHKANGVIYDYDYLKIEFNNQSGKRVVAKFKVKFYDLSDGHGIESISIGGNDSWGAYYLRASNEDGGSSTDLVGDFFMITNDLEVTPSKEKIEATGYDWRNQQLDFDVRYEGKELNRLEFYVLGLGDDVHLNRVENKGSYYVINNLTEPTPSGHLKILVNGQGKHTIVTIPCDGFEG